MEARGTMSLTKQAKVLSKAHVNVLSAFIAQTRYPVRNQAVLMLSVKAGLRAKEITNLTWDMVTDPDGILASCGATIKVRGQRQSG